MGNLARTLGHEGETAFAWDPAGMLAQVTPPEGPAVSFTTDALGQRVSKQVGAATTAYVWEKGRLVKTTGANAASFAYDELGKPLSMTLSGETYVYRTDERGSVIELTEADTNQPAATYSYDAWGNVLDSTGEQALLAANPFTYLGAHGVLTDPEVGLYQMGARTYDPVIGRFLSPDPAAADPAESPYVYAGNNPTSLMDPSGLSSEGARFSNYYRHRPRPKPAPPRPKPRVKYRPVYQIRREPVHQVYKTRPRASREGGSYKAGWRNHSVKAKERVLERLRPKPKKRGFCILGHADNGRCRGTGVVKNIVNGGRAVLRGAGRCIASPIDCLDRAKRAVIWAMTPIWVVGGLVAAAAVGVGACIVYGIPTAGAACVAGLPAAGAFAYAAWRGVKGFRGWYSRRTFRRAVLSH